GRPVEVSLGDHPPHALIGGPSGSGKTTFIYAWLAALCSRYPPEELELYLLDFKEGVSFARFAPGRRDPSWLPHVRLVGVNVNTDREFGLALLRHLGSVLKDGAAAAKRYEVTTLAELRAEDPDGHRPRIVAVVNADSGAETANRIERVPAASDRDTWSELQTRLWRRRPAGLTPPRLFDGDAVPSLSEAPDFVVMQGDGEPVALLGEAIDVS